MQLQKLLYAKAFKRLLHKLVKGEKVDKTDVILCQMLLTNSRLSYRELAEKLNLSVTAVHNRIQSLIEMDIIRKFTAKLTLNAKNGISILIFGTSKTKLIRDLNPKLEKHGSIYWLAIGGGNVLYIGAYLKNIADLDTLVHFVKEAAEMPEPTVGITVSPIPPLLRMGANPETKLCELDYKIIRSLKNDSRKATSVVAEELGVSAKTVRHRLARMVKNYLVQFSIDWYPDSSNDIIGAFHVQVKPDARPNAPNVILQKLLSEHALLLGIQQHTKLIPVSHVDSDCKRTPRDPRKLGAGTSGASSSSKHHLHRLHIQDMGRRRPVASGMSFFLTLHS